jgi:carbon storage regulator
MLVLTRKPGEDIVIGQNITVRVVAVGKSRVKIGVDAPKNVDVRRSELVVAERATARPTEDQWSPRL